MKQTPIQHFIDSRHAVMERPAAPLHDFPKRGPIPGVGGF
jgi:hypothetical protein